MKNILKVFQKDMKSIIKNPVAFIIVVGVAILPSLYAWVNILASWDPYSNTSTIKVAIVNEDQTTMVEGHEVNTGDMVVDNLKNNDKIDWDFVDSDVAETGLMKGYYIASITIDENFSRDLVSFVTEDQPTKPTIIYRVNTKENPVLSKISDAAQRTLIQTIKTNFILEINEVAFDNLNKIGVQIGDYEDEILGLKQSLLLLNSNMDFITSSLNNATATTETLNVYLKSLQSSIPTISDSIEEMKENNETQKDDASIAKNSALSALDQYNQSMENLKSQVIKANDIVDKSTTEALDSNEIDNVITDLKDELLVSKNQANEMILFLDGIKSELSVDDENIDSLISGLNDYSNIIDEQMNDIEKITENSDATNSDITTLMKKIKVDNTTSLNDISEINNNYETGFISNMNDIYDSYISYNEEQQNTLNSIEENLSSYNSVINKSVTQLETSGNLTINALNDLNYFKDSINFLANTLNGISDEQIKTAVTVLKNDPETMADDLTNPFTIVNEAIYPLDNYGSGMAPMYSSLAMWVGALILTSVFTTEVKDKSLKKLTLKEKHLGKMMLFIAVSLIQGLVLMVGNKVLLGVQTSNLFIFIAFGVYISICFSIIIYTNVAVFKDFGKALNVILLVLQIAGSGGAYPIQLDPLFFRTFYRFFPFTYALGIIRESINGILISALVYDVFMLTFITAIFFITGLFFKEKIHHLVEKFEKKFEEARIGE